MKKPSNPKDMLSATKVPLHLWPATATAYGSMALLDGAKKYGRLNYRAIGARASVYKSAAERHLNAWFEGERTAPDSGIHHLGHALACIAILIDAATSGVLEDDRNFPGGYFNAMAECEALLAAASVKPKRKSPKHYTIQDAL